jgi:acetyl-CoA carboxylase biotin carboxyl carrier protein
MDGNRNTHNKKLSMEEQDASENISIEQLEHLVQLFDKSDISELEVRQNTLRTRLILRKAVAPSENGSVAVGAFVAEEMEKASSEDTKSIVAAPLVGIFHCSAKPKGKPLVSVGDHVKVGQRVGTIQSLNVFNEVEAAVAGRVVEIVVEDGQAVEYGQTLMIIEMVEEA